MHNIKIPQVKDYETIDFRQVEKGEEYIIEVTKDNIRKDKWEASEKSCCFYWIIKKIPTLRPATSLDFPAFPCNCVFSHNGLVWANGVLHGVKVAPELSFWVKSDNHGGYFWVKYCRIEEI